MVERLCHLFPIQQGDAGIGDRFEGQNHID